MAGSVVLELIALNVAKLINVVVGLFHKAGFLSLLGLIEPINALKGVDLAKAKDELGDLDAAELERVERALIDNVSDSAVKAKMLAMEGYLEKAIDLAQRSITMVTGAKNIVIEAKNLFVEVKAFLGL